MKKQFDKCTIYTYICQKSECTYDKNMFLCRQFFAYKEHVLQCNDILFPKGQDLNILGKVSR